MQSFYASVTDSKFMDEYIPLDGVTIKDQQERAKDCECVFEDAVYWENEQHSHGWCCPNCGKVLQWG